MLHNHHHFWSICRHTDVRFCSVCNCVYCVDCHKEWYEATYQWTYTYPLTSGSPLLGNQTVTVGNNTTGSVTANATRCAHQEASR